MRTVERKLIDNWIEKNGPNGLEALARKSGVSPSMISKVRVGRVPVKEITRKALAQAIGRSESSLFPLANQRKAS